MAIALDQQAANNSAATTVVATITATASGALLVACISYATASSQSISGVTDSAGNTWHSLTAQFHTGSNSYNQIWYSFNAASVTSVTATGTSSGAKGINVTSWTGFSTTDPLEQSTGTNGTNATTVTAATVTTTDANTLVIKSANKLGNSAAGTLGWTGGTALTHPTGTTTGQSLDSAYKIYSSTSAGEVTTWTSSSLTAWGTSTAVFFVSSVTVKTDTDSATLTDTPSLSSKFTDTDSAALTDTPTPSAKYTDTDSGTLSDTPNLAAKLSDTDASTLSEAQNVIILPIIITDSDSATLFESAIVNEIVQPSSGGGDGWWPLISDNPRPYIRSPVVRVEYDRAGERTRSYHEIADNLYVAKPVQKMQPADVYLPSVELQNETEYQMIQREDEEILMILLDL